MYVITIYAWLLTWLMPGPVEIENQTWSCSINLIQKEKDSVTHPPFHTYLLFIKSNFFYRLHALEPKLLWIRWCWTNAVTRWAIADLHIQSQFLYCCPTSPSDIWLVKRWIFFLYKRLMNNMLIAYHISFDVASFLDTYVKTFQSTWDDIMAYGFQVWSTLTER